MGKKSNYAYRRKHDFFSQKRSIVAGVNNSKNLVKNDRIEWLKQLYAEWLGKRNSILNKNRKTYLIYEPDELDIETYW